MNYLLAKMKGRQNEFLKILTSKEDILATPDLSHVQNYSPAYKLEDDEWFQLDKFLSRNFYNGLIENKFSGTSFNQIIKDNYENIKYLCAKQGDLYLFQKISIPKLFSQKWFHLTNKPKLKTDPIIIINEWVDAVYDKQNDILYFKDIAKIKTMFKGIEELYREATQKEVDDFCYNNSFISLGKNFTTTQIKSLNRKRIAMAIDVLKDLSISELNQIVDYTKSYCPHVQVQANGDSFIINSEEDLKFVLFGIEQRYYTTAVKPKKRLANSVLEIV